MARLLQLRNGTLQEWVNANPILAEGELGVILGSSGNVVIGDGSTPYTKLHTHAWGLDAYDILVKDGAYKGSKEDFCRQLQSSLRISEQQAGVLTNSGPGWNSFTFPTEFTEECYVFLMPQDTSLHASVKNITKQGFQYCLFDSSDNTTDANIAINYLAVAVSDMDMAKAIATAAGLSPFDYDNLTTLFTDHAAEIVSNEAAFNLVKGSSMASGKYLCYLIGLDPEAYDNMNAISSNAEAMNQVANNSDAINYIQSSQVASDSMRGSSMSTAKYVCGILMINPNDVTDMLTFIADPGSVGVILANADAMKAVANSKVSIMAFRDNSHFVQDTLSVEASMGALANSKVAVNVFISNEISLMALISNQKAFNAVISKPENCCVINGNAFALDYIANSKLAMEQIAANDTAIQEFLKYPEFCKAIADSKVAMVEIAYNDNAMDRIVESDTALNAICDSNTAFSVITGRNLAIKKIANDKNAMEIVMNHEVSRNLFFLTDHCLGEGLVTYGEVGDDPVYELENYPQYTQKWVLSRFPSYTGISQYTSSIVPHLANKEKIAKAFAKSKEAFKEWLSNGKDSKYLGSFTRQSLAGKYIMQDPEARNYFMDNNLCYTGYALASLCGEYSSVIDKSNTGRSIFWSSSEDICKYIGASSTLMDIFCNDPKILEYVFGANYDDSYRVYYCKQPAFMNRIMNNKLARSYFFKSPAAVSWGLTAYKNQSVPSSMTSYGLPKSLSNLASDFCANSRTVKHILSDDYALNIFFQYSYVYQALMIYFKLATDSNYDSYNFDSIISSSTVLEKIRDHEGIMTLMAKSPYVAGRIGTYTSTIQYLWESEVAAKAFMTNLDNVDTFFKSTYYLGKAIAKYIGSDETDLNGNYTFAALVNKSKAVEIIVNHEGTMKAVAASPYALGLILKSTVAFPLLLNSEMALRSIFADERGISTVVGVNAALTTFLGNESYVNIMMANPRTLELILAKTTATQTLLASEIALRYIINDSESMSKAIGNDTLMNGVVADSSLMRLFASTPIAANAILQNEQRREEALSASSFVGLILSSYSGITDQELIDCDNIQLVVANKVAMDKLSKNQKVVDLIVASECFTSNLVTSYIAMEAMTSNQYAVDAMFSHANTKAALLNGVYCVGKGLSMYLDIYNEELIACGTMKSVITNVAVMQVLFKDINAMKLLISHPQALIMMLENTDIAPMVVESKTAMQLVMNDQQARDTFLASTVNVGPGLVTFSDCIADNIAILPSFTEIVGSTLAFADLIKNKTALMAVLSTASSVQAILDNSTALETFASDAFAMECLADSPMALNMMFKSTVGKTAFATHNDILQSLSIKFAKTIRNNPEYFTLHPSYQYAYSYTSTTNHLPNANHVMIVMSGSYYNNISANYTTILHGFDKATTIVANQWGDTEDERNTFIALGGVSISACSNGRNRIWTYVMS